MAEFLETYQQVVRRERLLRRLALIYCLGAILIAIGLYFEFGLLPSLFCFSLTIVAWIPLKKMAIKVLSRWLREKATKKED